MTETAGRTPPGEGDKDQTVTFPVRVFDVDEYGRTCFNKVPTTWDRTGIIVNNPFSVGPNMGLIYGFLLSASTGCLMSLGASPSPPLVAAGAVGLGLFGYNLFVLAVHGVRMRRLKRLWATHFKDTLPTVDIMTGTWEHSGDVYMVYGDEIVSILAEDYPRDRRPAEVSGNEQAPTPTPPGEPVRRASRGARYATAAARHNQVKEAYGAILSNPIEALLHSALMDTTNPHTERFVLAMYAANDLHATATMDDPAEVDEYTAAVNRLMVAWDDARGFAEKHGATWMPVEDQQRADTALGLLRHGASTGLTDAERITYLSKAYALIRDISVLRLDPRTVTALEAATGKAITG